MTDDDVTRRMRWDQQADADIVANGRQRYPRPERRPPVARRPAEVAARSLRRWALSLLVLAVALLALAYGPGPW